MDKEAIANRLKELASKSSKRSKAAQLRDVIDDIETALAAGVSRSEIIEELAKQGLDVSLDVFSATLYRIRKKRGGKSYDSTKPANKQKVLTTEPVETTQLDDEIPIPGSHNPADLNAIIGNTPDLAALAKIGKGKKKNDS